MTGVTHSSVRVSIFLSVRDRETKERTREVRGMRDCGDVNRRGVHGWRGRLPWPTLQLRCHPRICEDKFEPTVGPAGG